MTEPGQGTMGGRLRKVWDKAELTAIYFHPIVHNQAIGETV